MNPQGIFEKAERELGAGAVSNLCDGSGGDRDPWFRVEPYRIADLAILLKTDPELHFDYLECVTGVDLPEDGKIEVVYHVYSYAKRHRIVLKCLLDRADPALPTVSHVWPTANWQERECFDLLGVLFDGHPDLRRLLLPDDWVGHPLRKDYQQPESYHGIPTTRPNPIELFGAEYAEATGEPGADGSGAESEATA
jgi:NADH-quinone oxidoreductase subunit C